MIRAFILALFTFSVAGCAGFVSEEYEFDRSYVQAPSGPAYSLPKGYFWTSLIQSEPLVFELKLNGPQYLPDERHTYLLHLDEAPMHADAASVYFYSGTQFIQEIRLKSSSQVDEALVAAAQAREQIFREVNPESAVYTPEANTLAGPFLVDLLSQKDRMMTADRFEDAIFAAAGHVLESDACKIGVVGKLCLRAQTVQRELTAARELSDEKRLAGYSFVSFSIEPLGALPSTAAAPSQSVAQGDASAQSGSEEVGAPRPDCEKGVCYRPLRDFRISARIGPSPHETGFSDPWRSGDAIISLPNDGTVLSLDLPRPLLAKRGGRIRFAYPGVPEAVVTFRESEGYELVLLPFEVVGNALGATVGPFAQSADVGALSELGKLSDAPNLTSKGDPISFGPDLEAQDNTVLSVKYPRAILPVTGAGGDAAKRDGGAKKSEKPGGGDGPVTPGKPS